MMILEVDFITTLREQIYQLIHMRRSYLTFRQRCEKSLQNAMTIADPEQKEEIVKLYAELKSLDEL